MRDMEAIAADYNTLLTALIERGTGCPAIDVGSINGQCILAHLRSITFLEDGTEITNGVSCPADSLLNCTGRVPSQTICGELTFRFGSIYTYVYVYVTRDA